MPARVKEVAVVVWTKEGYLDYDRDEVVGVWFGPALRSAIDACQAVLRDVVEVWLDECAMLHWLRLSVPIVVPHDSRGWLNWLMYGPARRERWQQWTGAAVDTQRTLGIAYADSSDAPRVYQIQPECQSQAERATVDRERRAYQSRAVRRHTGVRCLSELEC